MDYTKAEAKQADAFRHGDKRSQQFLADSFECSPIRDRLRKAS